MRGTIHRLPAHLLLRQFADDGLGMVGIEERFDQVRGCFFMDVAGNVANACCRIVVRGVVTSVATELLTVVPIKSAKAWIFESFQAGVGGLHSRVGAARPPRRDRST